MKLYFQEVPELAARIYQRMSPEARSDTIWARTVSEAINVLRDYKDSLSIVYLSYRPYIPVYHQQEKVSGLAVAEYIRKMFNPEDFSDCTFIIETENPIAAKWMRDMLMRKGFKTKLQRLGTYK